MIAITNNNITEERIQEIVHHIEKQGVTAHVSRGTDRTVIGIIGKADPTLAEQLRQMKGIENVVKSPNHINWQAVISIQIILSSRSKMLRSEESSLLSWGDHVQ